MPNCIPFKTISTSYRQFCSAKTQFIPKTCRLQCENFTWLNFFFSSVKSISKIFFFIKTKKERFHTSCIFYHFLSYLIFIVIGFESLHMINSEEKMNFCFILPFSIHRQKFSLLNFFFRFNLGKNSVLFYVFFRLYSINISIYHIL